MNRYRFLTLLFTLFGVFWVGTLWAVDVTMTIGHDTDSNPANGIQNTHPHNLSSGNSTYASDSSEDQVCKFCHTPHGGSASGQLWNRVDPTGTFPLYHNGVGDLNIESIGAANYDNSDPSLYPNGATRLCLSCHDGVTAVGEVIVGGTLASITMPASGVIDLSSSHPVSFTYNATVEAALDALGTDYLRPDPALDLVKLDGEERMQCTTCHDPHVDTSTLPDTTYTLPMWRNYTGVEATDYSDTCSTCHSVDPGLTSDVLHTLP